MPPTPSESPLLMMPSRQGMNWSTTLAMVLLHIGAAAALFMFQWRYLALAALLWGITGGLGISMGYHRLHTHRSYRVPLWMEYSFAVLGALTFEGGPIFWVATHRIHHQNSDSAGDPHSPHDGAFWSHMGWLLFGDVNHNATRLMSKYAPDLARHRFYVWLNDYHWVPNVVLTGVLAAIGGWPLVLWGICLRVVVGLHSTWLVNSASHMWGYRRFPTRDDSRNNWWVALITFGEGWHNNHHAHPTSARHGLAWYEFDPTWILITILRKMGIARSIRVATLPPAAAEREAA